MRRRMTRAALTLERAELEAHDPGEGRELTAIYVARGVDPVPAKKVAEQLMAHDALGAHARDELGISARSARGRFKLPSRQQRASQWAQPCRCSLSP